ncbi:hypothetical protein DL768_006097 [Monosporascus sp. mg162]|nr:hypothetical protein DL768_006097 [Monosporascus sp. mg162]
MSGKQLAQAVEGHVSGQANEPLSRPAHALDSLQAAAELQTDPRTGLTAEEANARLAKYGPNDLGEERGVRPLEILIAQVVNAMTMVLLLALAASFAIKAWIEGGVLAALILINLVIGFFQDLQAARTIASLKSLNSPSARVIRGGESSITEVAKLVPGDVIELKTGDVVPADIRLLETVNLEADEALLTGESVPSRKDSQAVFSEDDTGPGDRLNIAFSSTTITKGRGRGVVFATGMFTEIGAIAAALRAQGGKKRILEGDENGHASTMAYFKFACGKTWDWLGHFLGVTVGTPLQRKLAQLFLYVFAFAIVCAIIVLAVNGFTGRNDVIIYAIATAIGMLPVTLILVLTITMAAGTKVMVQRNVLVRNMRSLEALGGVTSHGTYSIGASNEPYNPEVGDVSFTVAQPKDDQQSSDEKMRSRVTPASEASAHELLQRYLDVAAFANLATVKQVTAEEHPSGPSHWQAHGDPTEIAIQVFATRFGWTGLSSGESGWAQITEFPFDSAIKKMSVLCRNQANQEVHIFTKGAVERLIDSCSAVAAQNNELSSLTPAAKLEILDNAEALARQGLRVLALASRSSLRSVSEDEARHGHLKREEFETDLVFRGLIGIYDPPRPESRPSVFKCHQAGIGVHMLTGDHPETARAIAAEVGILPLRKELLRADIAETLVMTAHDFDRLTDAQLDALPHLPLVVARCAPSTKVRMIDALHRRHRYVAMTGDGVNDSPSLKRADVGIAMGLGGSDVAKSASDIVLSDDNFASILNAIEEGRRIFDNVQKFMEHVLAANIGFVTTLLIGLIYKDRGGVSIFQVTPVQILFLLLVAGAFTETGLGFESASPDVLNRPPESLKYGVFTPEFLADIVAYGILMAVCLIGSFVIVLFGFYDGELGRDCNLRYTPSCEGVFRARTTCYTAMMWIFLLFAWELVDSRRSFFDGFVSNNRQWAARLWRNPFLFWSVITGFVVVFPTIYIPVLNHVVFLHAPIDKEWGITFGIVILFMAGAEAWKWAKRVYLRRKGLMRGKKAGVDEEALEAQVFGKFQ